MPADLPPNYAYVVEAPMQEYIMDIEKKNGNDLSQYHGDKMKVYYSSQLQHLSEKLLDRIHNDLDYVPNIDYKDALMSQKDVIEKELPEVDKQMKRDKSRQAYLELLVEEHQNPVAQDVLWNVDNAIIDAMPDFYERIDAVKAEEAQQATEWLKEEGVLFSQNPPVESVAHIGNQQDFGINPAVDVTSLEETLTGHDPSKEIVLYRLPDDTGSMLRVSVGQGMVEEQNYAVCKATELPVLAQYNKHVHDLVSQVPEAVSFCNAQQSMMNLEKDAYEYGYADSAKYQQALKKVSDTYKRFGHVSPNPLHRVEDTVAAIEYAMKNNKQMKAFSPKNIGETMRVNGVGLQLAEDVKVAPNYYTKFTQKDEKQFISKLAKMVTKDQESVKFNQMFKEMASAKQASSR